MSEIKYAIPPELKASLEKLDYENEGGLTVLSIKYLEHELLFDFLISWHDDDDNSSQHWQLQVLNYIDSGIDVDNLDDRFTFYSDHFLLWEYIDRKTELYYRNGSGTPENLLADIYSIHQNVFDGFIPLEKFINDNNLLKQCCADFGLFARGSKRILEYYYDCLMKAQREPYLFGDYDNVKWDGNAWRPQDKNLKLALLGRTYFIGQEFIFKHLGD